MATERMAPEKKTAVFEPETVLRRERLHRALGDASVLEEFLVNPTEIANRHGIKLSDAEIEEVRQCSHFLASWDLFCGNGKWLDAVLPNEAAYRSAVSPSAGAVVAETVRSRIAEEILWDIPAAIRRTTERIEGDSLIEGRIEADELPPAARPLVRTLRALVRRVVREVNHELAGLSMHAAMARSTAGQPQPALAPQPVPPSQPAGDGMGQLAGVLASYISEAVDRAVREAVQRVGQPTHQPFRQFAMQGQQRER
jgi:hypothetical protein